MSEQFAGNDAIASIERNRIYQPAPIPARPSLRIRITRAARTAGRQLSPLGWALVITALAIGAGIAAFT